MLVIDNVLVGCLIVFREEVVVDVVILVEVNWILIVYFYKLG